LLSWRKAGECNHAQGDFNRRDDAVRSLGDADGSGILPERDCRLIPQQVPQHVHQYDRQFRRMAQHGVATGAEYLV
jgi:hypothetical protein